MSARRRAVGATWIGVNVLFAAFHPSLPAVWPPPLTSLVVGAMLFVLPAAGWALVVRSAGRVPGLRLAAAIGISTLTFLIVLGAIRAAGLPLTPAIAWNATWLLTNLGFAAALIRPHAAARRSLTRTELVLGALTFVVCFGSYYYAATRVVPPQADHDLELQATGYGLLTRFEPLLLTDRRTIYYFAHPPLLHYYVGGSFLYLGALPDLEFFDEASRRARDAEEGRSFSPPRVPVRGDREHDALYWVSAVDGAHYQLSPVAGGASRRVPVQAVELAQIYARYERTPHEVATRTPNLFLASATVAILAIWAGRISRQWWIGLLAAAAYASNPEVFVRSSYGGYFAVGALACVFMLLADERWRRRPIWRLGGMAVVAGAFAALTDHKMILLPAAMAVHTAAIGLSPGVRAGRDGGQVTGIARLRQGLVRGLTHPVAIGFGLGLIIFWGYGFLTAPAAFLEDHFHHHLIDRITHTNPLGYDKYPGRVELWSEFSRHTGYLLLPAAIVLMGIDVVTSWRKGSPRVGSPRGLWLLWTLLSAAVFTAVDWRMTKHLMPMLLPLYLGLVPDRHAARWRTTIPVVLLIGLLIWNVRAVWGLVGDFDAFQVTPDW